VNVFARGERRWWPWAPVLLAEGLYARLATTRLPPARDTAGSVGTGNRGLRLAGLGDSIIAGIGVESQSEGLIGRVAAGIAARAGVEVQWRAFGESGATSATVQDRLLPAALEFGPEIVVLSVGVNDAVAGVEPTVFRERLRSIIDALAASPRRPTVVFGGIPPLDSFPALPWPLSELLGDRARALQAAAVQLTGFRGTKVVVFPARLEPAAFSRDRFHPGARGCNAWSEWIVNGLALRLEAIANAQGPRERQ
jgi:lysophospholipase L1-like esterase